MGLRIQNNIEAFNTHRQLSATAAQASKSMEKLSSGYRINRAADDAAGLSISEKMRAQISGLGQAQRNAQDAISLVQTAEGALGEVHSMLERVRDLRVQIGAGTLDTSDKEAIGAEVIQIASEISNIMTTTSFNGKKLLDGSAGSMLSFQVGADNGETIAMSASTLSSTAIGATGGISDVIALSTSANAAAAVTTFEGTGLALDKLTQAVDAVS